MSETLSVNELTETLRKAADWGEPTASARIVKSRYAREMRRLIREAREALLSQEMQIKHLSGYYSDLNEEAIVRSRELLKNELGIEAAFFDDCVGIAIRRCQKAEAALTDPGTPATVP